jgi:hypothetical protein
MEARSCWNDVDEVERKKEEKGEQARRTGGFIVEERWGSGGGRWAEGGGQAGKWRVAEVLAETGLQKAQAGLGMCWKIRCFPLQVILHSTRRKPPNLQPLSSFASEADVVLDTEHASLRCICDLCL